MEINLNELAKNYEPPKTKNITELELVPTNAVIQERVFNEGKADEFRVLVYVKEGVEYRVPISVVISLKAILKEKPELKFFKVTKEGEGKQTKYTVIPLE